MGVFIGVITILSMVMAVIGLVSPKTILPKEPAPTRGKAVGAAAGLWIVLAAGGGIVSAIFWADDKSKPDVPVAVPSDPVSPVQAVATAAKGMGIGRAQAAAVLKKHGCPLEKSSDVDGVERWQGQKDLIMCEVIGPATSLHKVFMLKGLVKGDANGALATIVGMTDVIKLALPAWDGGGQWLVAAIKAEGGSTIRDGIAVEVRFFPQIGLGLSLQSAQ